MTISIAWGTAVGGGLPSGTPYPAGGSGNSDTAGYGDAVFGFSGEYSGPPVVVMHAFRATSDGEWVEQTPRTLDPTHPSGRIPADALGEHILIPSIGGYKCGFPPLYINIYPGLEFQWGVWEEFEGWGPGLDPGPDPKLAWGTQRYGGVPSGAPFLPGNSGTSYDMRDYLHYSLVGTTGPGHLSLVGLDVRVRFYPQEGGDVEDDYHPDGGLGLDRDNGTYKVTLYIAGRLTSPMLVATVLLSEEGYGTVVWYEVDPEDSNPRVDFWTLLRNAEETP